MRRKKTRTKTDESERWVVWRRVFTKKTFSQEILHIAWSKEEAEGLAKLYKGKIRITRSYPADIIYWMKYLLDYK